MAPAPGGAAVHDIEEGFGGQAIGGGGGGGFAAQRGTVVSQQGALPCVQLAAQQFGGAGAHLLYGFRRHPQHGTGLGGRMAHGLEPGGLALGHGEWLQRGRQDLQVDRQVGGGRVDFGHDQLAQLAHKPALFGRLGGVEKERFRLARGEQDLFQQRPIPSPFGYVVRQHFADDRNIARDQVVPPLGGAGPAVPDHFVAGIDHLSSMVPRYVGA